ncbi:MAG: hypothetical protein JNM80_06960 [Phycisphaerae bacterium]|nr:hypothetical protein [Phycisphaerae bacterium]
MKPATSFIVGLLASASIALAGPERIVHVASSDPEPREFVGVEPGSGGDGAAINNYECVGNDAGCPAGTKIIDASGNFVGCGAGCSGNCNACSGNTQVSPQLCSKKQGETCYLAVNTVNCGNKGAGTCGTTGPGSPDNNGCFCTPPTAYPPSGERCDVRQCL